MPTGSGVGRSHVLLFIPVVLSITRPAPFVVCVMSLTSP
jgi:hypothetical protein